MTAPVAEHPGHAGEADSLQELRPLHVALLKEWAGLDDARKAERAEAFRQAAQAAGRWIKNLDERDSAQSLLDYWTATMAGMPSSEAYPKLVTLAAFDPATVQTSSKRSPFVGLDPFRVEDRDRFHGRDRVRDELLAASQANPLLVVTGPSALGKSSLVQAGLAGTLGAQPGWKILGPTTPGSDPVASLLRAVRPDKAAPGWLDDQRDRLESNPDHLRILAEHELPPDQGTVLVIDRAEEMFTFDVGNAEIGVAAAALAAFVAGPRPGRHRVILDIREDYLEQLRAAFKAARLELADAAIARPRPPTPENLGEAVMGPAESVGLKIDPAVLEALVADLAGQADALPLLQFTLSKLWDAAETDRVGMAEYEAVGRPSLIVQSVAERVYAGLDGTDAQETARLAFLEMIRVGQYVSRRRQRRDDLREALEKAEAEVSPLNAVLKAFDKAGLVRRIPGDNAGDDCFEIAHEAVIRNWPRLLIWLQDRRRGDDARERVMAALERWRASGRRGGLLLRGQGLKEASAFALEGGALGEYIAASRRRRTIVRVSLAVIIVTLVAGIFLWDAWKARRERDLQAKEDVAIAAAREETVLGEDFQRQAIVTDQALLGLVIKHVVDRDAVPTVFLDREQMQPASFPAGELGYDPNFLRPARDNRAALTVPMPMPRAAPGQVRILQYPHATIVYDTRRRLALLVATNYDRDASPLAPFRGIGSFPDRRFPSAEQNEERISLDLTQGLVPMVSFQEVGWRRNDRYKDASFVHFAPFAVLQPWRFYLGPWARIENRLLGLPAGRITFFTGPVVIPASSGTGEAVVPESYFKIAVYRDDATGEIRVLAYIIDLRADVDEADPRALTTVAEIARATGIDFGALGRTEPASSGAAAAAQPTVFLHFASMPRSTAVGIRRALAAAGYSLPGEEGVEVAGDVREVTFGHAEDLEAARALARRTEEILSNAGFPEGRVGVRQLGKQRLPPRGVLQLLLSCRPPPGGAR